MTDPRETARKRMADKKARERGDKLKDTATKGVVMGVAGSATSATIGAVSTAAASSSTAAVFAAPTLGSLGMSSAAIAAPLAATGIGLPVAAAMLVGIGAITYFGVKSQRRNADD